MEVICCPNHPESRCLLKTGTKPGPSQGVSFYVCSKCKFVKDAKLPPSKCSIHKDRVLELQSFVVSKDQKGIRRYYRCEGRDEGQSWCGHIQVMEKKIDTLSNSSGASTDDRHRREHNNIRMETLKDDVKNMDVSNKENEKKEKDSLRNVSTAKTHGHSHCRKLDHEKKSDVSTKPLTFSDLSGKGKDVPSSWGQGNTTPFQNKSFHHYRDSPDPSQRPGKPVVGHQRRGDSSNDDSDEDVQGTHSLMKGLTINDKDVKSKAMINSGYLDDSVMVIEEECTMLPAPDSGPRKTVPNVIDLKENDNAKSVTVTNDLKVHAFTESKEELSKKSIPEQKAISTIRNVGEKDKMDGTVEKSKVDIPKQTLSMEKSGAGDVAHSQKFDFNANARLRSLKEDRMHTVAEMNKFQISLRGVKLDRLPDKGEKLLSRVASFKQAVSSLDRQIAALLHQYGLTGDEKQLNSVHTNPQQPQVIRVYPGNGNTKTVIVRPNSQQAAIPGNSSVNQNASSSGNVNGGIKPSGSQFVQMPSHFSQYFAANPQAMTLYGGRMTAQRLREVGSITTEAIDKLHKSLESCPSESTDVTDPDGLRVELMSHQRQALAWLDWREQQHPPGGILADDMGLGKTLTMISHIMRRKQEVDDAGSSASSKEGWLGKDKKKSIKKSRATLIVTPASLVHQWAKEIERRCKPNCLKVLVYHGPNRESNINRLADNDVVITTYAIVSKEVGADGKDAEMAVKDEEDDDDEEGKQEDKKSTASLPLLLRIGWERIILDEAHDIKNHKSARSQSVCRLRAAYRWALTGTPIQNDLKDIYSLLRFLRFSPFDELKVWKKQIENAKVSTKRLNLLVKALLLRRTKDQTTQSGKPLVDLPTKTYQNIEVDLSEEEQRFYDKLYKKSQSTVRAYVHRHQDYDNAQPLGGSSVGGATAGCGSGGVGGMTEPIKPKNTGSQILVFLLRLRQCCSHLSLLKSQLELESMETDGIELSLQQQMKGLVLDEETESASSSPDVPKTSLFEMASLSTKLSCVMTKIQTLQTEKPTDKSVIVSQWTAMLDIVAFHLKRAKVSYGLIQGNIPPKKRADVVDDFNRTGAGAKVLLVSLCAGGVGLNLIGGNNLFLLDSHWNPALEEQACDRIYRIGQTKDVHIYRFICKKTIEEKIWMLQQGKLSLAKSVLSGTANKNQKLSLDDLRMLFGV